MKTKGSCLNEIKPSKSETKPFRQRDQFIAYQNRTQDLTKTKHTELETMTMRWKKLKRSFYDVERDLTTIIDNLVTSMSKITQAVPDTAGSQAWRGCLAKMPTDLEQAYGSNWMTSITPDLINNR